MTANRPRMIATRWLRYSVRTLLIAILMLSLPLGWFGCKLQHARRQRAAVAAITQAGGCAEYEYDWERDGYRLHPSQAPKPKAPIWLWELLGHDLFVDIVGVSGCYAFSSTEFNDQTARHLEDLPSLKSVNLRWTHITDHGVAHIAHLHNLERLDLGLTKLTDAALPTLSRLENLKYLDISGTQVTDDGLRHLTRLANLQELHVFCDGVTGEGIAALQNQLPRCKINVVPPSAASPVVDSHAQQPDNDTADPTDE